MIPKKDNSQKKIVFSLWGHIEKKRKRQLLYLSILMIVASLSEMASIGAVLPFLAALASPDIIYNHSSVQRVAYYFGIYEANNLLLPLTFIFALSALMAGFFRIMLVWGETRLGHAVGADLSKNIFRKMLYQSYEYHIDKNGSEIIAAITVKVDRVVYGVILPIISMVGQLLLLSFMVAILVAIDYEVASFSFIGFGLIYGLIMLFTRKMLTVDSICANQESGRVVKILQEGLGGIREILIGGFQDIYVSNFGRHDGLMRKSLANVQIIGSIPRFGVEAIGVLFIAILAYRLNYTNGLVGTIPILGTLAIGSQRMLPIIQQLFLNWTKLRGSSSALKDAVDLLNNPVPANANLKFAVPINFEDKIKINSLSYGYGVGKPLVLSDINFSIPKGSVVGFIGPTGSGKSTLIDLIIGLLTPTGGSISVDEVDIVDENRRSWQNNISHVPQVIFLSDATIAENIAFGIPIAEIDFKRVEYAASIAQIDSTIKGWEKGYKTIVGERGVKLSGGQRQRIGIARALYDKNSKILVLDEATSALDNATEEMLMTALNNVRRDITVLMIAHRLSTLKKCDLIIELDGGRIKKIGSYCDVIG